jgi:hypothetical protein
MAKKEAPTAKTTPVNIDSGLVLKAKIAAEDKGLELSDHLSELLKAPIEREWARARNNILEAWSSWAATLAGLPTS